MITEHPTLSKTPKIKRQRLSPADRRQQLLELAVTAYAQQGVERAGHGDIAKLTSASTATVFNYFPTREALTEAVLTYVSEKLISAISQNGETAGENPVEVLSHLILGLDALIDDSPDVAKVILNWSVSFGPSVRPQYLKFHDAVLTLLHQALRGQTTGSAGERAEARLIYAAAISYTTMKLDKSPEAVIKDYVTRVLGIFK